MPMMLTACLQTNRLHPGTKPLVTLFCCVDIAVRQMLLTAQMYGTYVCYLYQSVSCGMQNTFPAVF